MVAVLETCERERALLSRAPRVQAVSLHAGDRAGSVCVACEDAAAAAGDGG